jgi:hypothetical protein
MTRRRVATPSRPRLMLAAADLALLWRNAVRFTAALVIAAFPFVFFFDEAMDLSFSPVLPALAFLVLVVVALPPLIVEVRTRRVKDLEKLRTKVLRGAQTTWALLGLSIVWLLFWFSWGL